MLDYLRARRQRVASHGLAIGLGLGFGRLRGRGAGDGGGRRAAGGVMSREEAPAHAPPDSDPVVPGSDCGLRIECELRPAGIPGRWVQQLMITALRCTCTATVLAERMCLAGRFLRSKMPEMRISFCGHQKPSHPVSLSMIASVDPDPDPGRERLREPRSESLAMTQKVGTRESQLKGEKKK